jgi:hypothetical protein
MLFFATNFHILATKGKSRTRIFCSRFFSFKGKKEDFVTHAVLLYIKKTRKFCYISTEFC